MGEVLRKEDRVIWSANSGEGGEIDEKAESGNF